MKKEYTIENIGNVCVVYNSWTGAFNVFNVFLKHWE